jgi:hypothetical protein
LEIVFDTEIDDDDINRVNRIRYFMNLILRQDGGKVNISHSHNAVQKEIIALLKKDRKRTEEEIYAQEEYVWNKQDPDDLLKPSNTIIYKHLDIFVPHYNVRLNKDNNDGLSWDWSV